MLQGCQKRSSSKGFFLRAVCCSGTPAGAFAPPWPPVPAVAAGSKTCGTAPGREAAGCCGICIFLPPSRASPNPGGSGHVKGARAHRAQRGRPLTWPRQDYIALPEEEEKRCSNRQPPAAARGRPPPWCPTATAGGQGKEHAPAPGARLHPARQSKTVRPTAERSDLRGVVRRESGV